MAVMVEDNKPVCPCCQGSGVHAYRAYARGASPEDDDEGCTTCHETGRTHHSARPDTCLGYRTLQRRTHHA